VATCRQTSSNTTFALRGTRIFSSSFVFQPATHRRWLHNFICIGKGVRKIGGDRGVLLSRKMRDSRQAGKTFAVMSAAGRSKCFKYAYHFVFGCIWNRTSCILLPAACSLHLPATDARTKDTGELSTRTTHVTAKVKSLPSMFAFQVSLLAGSSFCAAHRRP